MNEHIQEYMSGPTALGNCLMLQGPALWQPQGAIVHVHCILYSVVVVVVAALATTCTSLPLRLRNCHCLWMLCCCVWVSVNVKHQRRMSNSQLLVVIQLQLFCWNSSWMLSTVVWFCNRRSTSISLQLLMFILLWCAIVNGCEE